MIDFDYIIYTDGACLGNPGPGGWGAIIFDSKNNKIKLSGSSKNSTNNKMEIIAAIESLKNITSKSKIQIFTDSKYLIDGINNWINKWKINNWKTANKKDVKNKDLWVELDVLIKEHDIEWKWVKGHSCNLYNEEVDKIARFEAEKLQCS